MFDDIFYRRMNEWIKRNKIKSETSVRCWNPNSEGSNDENHLMSTAQWESEIKKRRVLLLLQKWKCVQTSDDTCTNKSTADAILLIGWELDDLHTNNLYKANQKEEKWRKKRKWRKVTYRTTHSMSDVIIIHQRFFRYFLASSGPRKRFSFHR